MEPVVVIGGGLSGMAAAARLAKLGRPVTLLAPGPQLGGPDGVPPPVVDFPAPWRDLFRKSGRPLEAELARRGSELAPAAAPRYRFDDGSTLVLPTDRGEQLTTLTTAYGRGPAERWRDLLDRLDTVWQALRPLGFETERTSRVPYAVRRTLFSRRTVADLAVDLHEPHLAAVLRSAAHRCGSAPEQTPALVAALTLGVQRTFGRWAVRARPGSPATEAEPPGLVDLLRARLELRGVSVHLAEPVSTISVTDNRVVAVVTAAGSYPAGSTVLDGDPAVAVRPLPPGTLRRTRQGLARRPPAHAPAVSHAEVDPVPTVTETVELSEDGVPRITWVRPAGPCGLATVHDYTSSRPDPHWGTAWAGFGSWLDRPPARARGPRSSPGPSPPTPWTLAQSPADRRGPAVCIQATPPCTSSCARA